MVYIYVLQLNNNKYYIGKTIDPQFRLENHFDSSGSAWTKKYKPIRIHELIPNCSNYDEQRITQKYMKKYGIDNVRGGPWCKLNLEKSEKDFIHTLILGENDKCYKCGSSDHFIKDCKTSLVTNINSLEKKPQQSGKSTCSYCGIFGHNENECYSKKKGRKINNNLSLKQIYPCKFCKKEFDSKRGCKYHENIHCPKRKKQYKSYDAASSLIDELLDFDSSDDLYSSDDDLVICYRCGRDGHYANSCYATRHIKGYYL